MRHEAAAVLSKAMNRIGPGTRMRCAINTAWLLHKPRGGAGAEWRRPRPGRPAPQSFRPGLRHVVTCVARRLCCAGKNINRFHSTLCEKQKRHFEPLFRIRQMGYLYLTERSKNKNKTYFVVSISTKILSVGDVSW